MLREYPSVPLGRRKNGKNTKKKETKFYTVIKVILEFGIPA